jgi:hypothetical protein
MKGMILSAAEVRALLNTRPDVWPPEPIDPAKPYKGVTRRIVKPQPDRYFEVNEIPFYLYDVEFGKGIIKPPYRAGDVLYVRETWCNKIKNGKYGYRSDRPSEPGYLQASYDDAIWRPSIHMPREAARLFAVVKDVRVERLQDISEEQAVREGFLPGRPRLLLALLWDSLNAKQPECQWKANPAVFAYEFMRTEGVRLP